MTNRTPDMPCLLCQVNSADKTGSHFTPAGIIKKIVGERDKEEIYSIDASAHSISRFMGRANLKNEDPEIKQGEHVADYIFCSSCEKKLGVIEGVCNQKLNLLVDDVTRSNSKVHWTREGNKFVSLQGIDTNVLLLYLYSIVWRQCLSQQLSNGVRILLPAEQELLRQIVSAGISMSLPEVKADPAYDGYPRLQLLTTYHKDNSSTNMFNPNAERTNPYLFFVGPYDVLLHLGPVFSPHFSTQTGLPGRVVDNELIINAATTIPVGIINEPIWMGAIKRLMGRQASVHNDKIYRQLSRAKGIPYELARYLITREAATFADQYPDNSSACMNLALEKLLSQRQ